MLMLVFDAAPEFDGEPIPDENDEISEGIDENQYFYRKCA
jgi:hypothetical protein